MVKDVDFMISEDLASGPGTRLQTLRTSCGRCFITVKKDRESVWHRHQKGESAPLAGLIKALYTFRTSGGSDGKASAYNAGDPGSIPGSGRSPGEGNGNPLQYSCLENPVDGGAWWAIVRGVAKSWTGVRDFTFFIYFY